MKTKVFTFNTGGDFLILATAINLSYKCVVNFCYSNSNETVYPSDLDGIDFKEVIKFAKTNPDFEEFISIVEI